MGKENKLFLPFRDSTIVDNVIQKIKASAADNIVIVGSALSLDQLQKYTDDRTSVVDNPDYETGMTSSIKSGVKVSEKTDGFMICLGDQPLISTRIYDQIIDCFKNTHSKNPSTIVVPFHQQKKGNPVIFSSIYKEDILKHTEPEGCKEIVQMNKAHVHKIVVQSSSILEDIDTRQDFEGLSHPSRTSG
jgi:molybdenum cofactor cytidylyltransferase